MTVEDVDKMWTSRWAVRCAKAVLRVLDIMMNLRKVVFVLHLNKILRLKAQGTGTVKASDFEKDADIEILTPDVPLATLDKDGVLEMEVCVERGRGYAPAEKREPEALPINAEMATLSS